MLIVIYVDDLIIIGDSDTYICDGCQATLEAKIQNERLGRATIFLRDDRMQDHFNM